MSATHQQQSATISDDGSARPLGARVVFLTHYISLYQVRVLQSIAKSVRDFRVLLSTPIEPNRDFTPDWSGLDVTVQDAWTVRRRWRHRDGGFEDPLFVHFPYDTGRRLRDLKPDVVMSLELGARSAGAASYCRRNAEAKLILCTYMSQRTEQDRGWMRSLLRKRLIRHADAVTYNGPSCRQYLVDLGVAEDRLFHLPYAADDRTVHRGPVERDDDDTRGRLLVVGQLSDRKGVLPFAQQLSEYCNRHPHRQIELLFAGDGPLREPIANLSVPPNLQLKLLGNLPPDELLVWQLRCGALIAPTLADEWMLVVNEALQSGLPVIGSIHSQAVETLVKTSHNGWTYDPAQRGSLDVALDKYFDVSTESLADMRHQARQSVIERTPQWAAAGAVEAIASVLGTNRPSCSANASRSAKG